MRRMIPDNKWKEVKNVTEPLSYDSANRKLTIDADLQMTGDILVADEDQQSVKKIYWHTVKFVRQGEGFTYFEGFLIILSNSPTPINVASFSSLLNTTGFFAVVINGLQEVTAGATAPTADSRPLIGIQNIAGTTYIKYRDKDTNVIGESSFGYDPAQWNIVDLGANPIN